MAVLSEDFTEWRSALLAWYRATARDLPWRRNQDPYPVWISEVMLQQTRVDQATPYFVRFLNTFPHVEALARADLSQLLSVWEGLGYYSRARNLHRASQQIVHTGWPQSYGEWLALPGVGPYTAAALSAILLHEPHGAVDGNVRRVYSRIMAYDLQGKALQDFANRAVDPHNPGSFNQALMDLGATICTPRHPHCPLCPMAHFCQSLAQGRVTEFPVQRSAAPVPERRYLVIIAQHKQALWVRKRPPQGLLGGLWELPNIEITQTIDLGNAYQGLIPTVFQGQIRHRYTHFRACFELYQGNLEAQVQANCHAVEIKDLEHYPFSRGFRKVLKLLPKD